MTVSELATARGKVVACRSCGVSTLAVERPLACPACGADLAWGVIWPGQGEATEAWSDARRGTAAILSRWSHRLESLEAPVFADDFGSDETRAVAQRALTRLKTALAAERSTLHRLADHVHPVMCALYAPALRRVHDTLGVSVNSRDVEAWRRRVFAAVGEIAFCLSEIP